MVDRWAIWSYEYITGKKKVMPNGSVDWILVASSYGRSDIFTFQNQKPSTYTELAGVCNIESNTMCGAEVRGKVRDNWGDIGISKSTKIPKSSLNF